MTALEEKCNNPIKIGFEVGDSSSSEQSIWQNKGDYRECIRALDLNGDNIMYLVTKSTDVEFVNSIAAYLGIPSDRVYFCDDNNTILAILGQLEISIYLTNDVEIVNLGNSNTDILANILVDYKLYSYGSEGKWFEMLRFWLNRRLKGLKSE